MNSLPDSLTIPTGVAPYVHAASCEGTSVVVFFDIATNTHFRVTASTPASLPLRESYIDRNLYLMNAIHSQLRSEFRPF